MLFGRLELQCRRFQMLIAGANMKPRAVRQSFVRSGHRFLEKALRFFELVFLQSANTEFVVLYRLDTMWIFGCLLLSRRFYWHSTASLRDEDARRNCTTGLDCEAVPRSAQLMLTAVSRSICF